MEERVETGESHIPLLFVIAMKYFSKMMKKMGKRLDFFYHHTCASIELNRLIFADDIMIVCKGDIKSMVLMKRTLKKFAEVSGLVASNENTAMYFGSVDEES